MFEPGIIFAAADDNWMKVVGFVVLFAIYAINHLITAAKAAKNKTATRKNVPKPPRENTERKPRQPETVYPEKETGTTQLGAEIEEFLKRASQRRTEKGRGEKGAGNKPRREPPAPPQPRKPLREAPVDVEPLDKSDFNSVSESVEKHMANRGFTERAEHLADDIVRADRQMEQHVQEAFGRRLGTLGSDPVPTVPVTDAPPQPTLDQSPAARLAALLTQPNSLGNLIAAKEILDRPEHRW